MEQRILQFIDGCHNCPKREYNSGGRYLCALVGQDVTSFTRIPSFCPLPTYPARTMAKLEGTVKSLQAGLDVHFVEYLFSFVAAKLRLLKEPSSAEIDIPFLDRKEERLVTIRFDMIKAIELRHGLKITFWYENKTYILHVEDKEPCLEEEIQVEGRDEPTYFHHRVTVGG